MDSGIYREPDWRCAVCRKPLPQDRIAVGAFTCGERVCHEAFVIRLERQFGKHKRVVDIVRGKVFLVPVRDIIEKGIGQKDLWQYPSVEPTRKEAIRFEAEALMHWGAVGRGCWFCEVGEPIDYIETRGRKIGICLGCVRRFTGWSIEAWEDHRAPYRDHVGDRIKAAIKKDREAARQGMAE